MIKNLDAASERVAKAFSTTNPDSESAVSEAFQQLTEAMQRSHVNSTDRRQIAAIAFAGRLLTVCHGAFTAIRFGNISSAQILVRSGLEALFALGGLSDQRNFEAGEDFYMRLLYKSKHSRLKALNRFMKDCATLPPDRRVQGEAKLKALEQELVNIREFHLTQVRDMADAASMLDIYARDYAHQSSPTHADMEDVIGAHVKIEGGNVELTGLTVGRGNVKEICAHLVLVLMEATTAVENLFSITPSAEHTARRASISKFYGNALNAAT